MPDEMMIIRMELMGPCQWSGAKKAKACFQGGRAHAHIGVEGCGERRMKVCRWSWTPPPHSQSFHPKPLFTFVGVWFPCSISFLCFFSRASLSDPCQICSLYLSTRLLISCPLCLLLEFPASSPRSRHAISWETSAPVTMYDCVQLNQLCTGR